MGTKTIILFVLLFSSFAIFGIDTSNGNGDWESNAAWTKGIEPTTEDTLIIELGDTLDITSNYTYPVDVIIIVRGAIRFSGKLNLSADSELYTDGGTGTLITTGGGNSDKLKIGGVGYWDGNDGNLVVDTGFPLGPPLPVLWGWFNIVAHLNVVTIEWTTFTELNNDYFIIQTSTDALTWKSIVMVPGFGNSMSTINYKETFETNHEGILYVRLKQVDYDGEFDYSKIFSTNTMQPIDTNVLHYVDMMGSKSFIKPKTGFFVIIYKNGQISKVFIK